VRPRLITTYAPEKSDGPDGIVVLVHGGASRAGKPSVSPTQLSVLRMIPIARRIARSRRGRLAVVRLLNSHRGWDTRHTPAMDVSWALARLDEEYDGRPVALVGHSLGGRAALLGGHGAHVRAVVALNPWLYPDDDPDLTGRQVLFVHGTDDRIAPMSHARAVARRVGRTAAAVEFVEVPGGKHAMLRGGRAFETAAAEFVTEALGSGRGSVTGP
jgi:pimeloyl-ACP methyl ester carboxylesterase